MKAMKTIKLGTKMEHCFCKAAGEKVEQTYQMCGYGCGCHEDYGCDDGNAAMFCKHCPHAEWGKPIVKDDAQLNTEHSEKVQQ